MLKNMKSFILAPNIGQDVHLEKDYCSRDGGVVDVDFETF